MPGLSASEAVKETSGFGFFGSTTVNSNFAFAGFD
jgi:hypothetical protein